MGKQLTNGIAIIQRICVKKYTTSGLLEEETVYLDTAQTMKEYQTVYTYRGKQLLQSVKTTYFNGTEVVQVETTTYVEEVYSDGRKNVTEKRG